MLPDNEIEEGMSSLKSKQRKAFNVVHKWDRNYVKYDVHDVQLANIFPSGSGGTAQSHLVNLLSNAILETCLYRRKDPEKPFFFPWTYRNISSTYMLKLHSFFSLH